MLMRVNPQLIKYPRETRLVCADEGGEFGILGFERGVRSDQIVEPGVYVRLVRTWSNDGSGGF